MDRTENPAAPGPRMDTRHDAIVSLARDLRRSGDLADAVEAYEQAIALAPHRTELLVELGMLRQESSDPHAALNCFRQALDQDPDNVAALQNLGCLLCNLGAPDEALACYTRALRSWPSPINQLLAATVLPVIYRSRGEIARWRQRMAGLIRSLADSGLRIDTNRSQIPPNFLLAYQGENDRDIAADLGRICQGVDLRRGAPAAGVRSRPDRRLRIGFLSAYYCDHTIGRLQLGIVRHLSRSRFHVTVLSASLRQDEWSTAFEQAADRHVRIPRNVEQARLEIAAQDLDLLVFADVGMDAVTSTLVYSRMAPVQCVTWGHPDTTGSPAIDYFISGSLLEAADADAHYTERLVRVPGIGVYYHQPIPPQGRISRETFGLSDQRHLYVCPQTLFKFHPDFDQVLEGILQADPSAEIIVLEGHVRNWAEQLRGRWSEALPESGRRVRFLPPQPYDQFLGLLSVADVVLDPLHFGGGNSSYEALAMTAPVVTLPSPFLRGRITAALYAKMGCTELVANSPRHYIDLAVRLGTDPGFNQFVRGRIRDTSPVLFEDLGEIRGWEEFFESAAAGHHLLPARAVP